MKPRACSCRWFRAWALRAKRSPRSFSSAAKSSSERPAPSKRERKRMSRAWRPANRPDSPPFGIRAWGASGSRAPEAFLSSSEDSITSRVRTSASSRSTLATTSRLARSPNTSTAERSFRSRLLRIAATLEASAGGAAALPTDLDLTLSRRDEKEGRPRGPSRSIGLLCQGLQLYRTGELRLGLGLDLVQPHAGRQLDQLQPR